MISQSQEWAVEGEYVDLKDKSNGWYCGYVLSRTKNLMKIRIEGWPAKYDETHYLNTIKAKPFRSIIRGYTGQKTHPSVREHWKFTHLDFNNRLQQFKTFRQDINNKTGKQLTQIIRGSNYFYIDFLLSNGKYPSAEDIKLISIYFVEHVKLTAEYLRRVNEIGIEEWFGDCSTLTTHEQKQNFKSYVECYFEIFDSMYSLTGNYSRHATFFKNNASSFNQAWPQFNNFQEFIAQSCTQLQVITQYLKLLTSIKIFCQKKQHKNKLPFTFIYAIFHLFLALEKIFKKEEKSKISIFLLEIIQKQFDKITSQDLVKKYEDDLEPLFSEMKKCYFKYSNKNAVTDWIEKSKLKIGILLIESEILEKKLKGISKIKDFLELMNSQNSKELQLVRMNQETFSVNLKELRFLEKIFEQNEHPEVVKRAIDLSKQLYRYKIISMKDLLFIWQNCFHKHEAVKKVVLTYWILLIPSITEDDFERFTEVLVKESQKTLLKEQENQHELHFVEDYQISFLLSFQLGLIKLLSDVSSTTFIDKIQQVLETILFISYEKLLENQKIASSEVIITLFAKCCAESGFSFKIIQKIQENIKQKRLINLNIDILTQICSQSFGFEIQFPSSLMKVLFEQLQVEITNRSFVSKMLRLIDEMMSCSSTISESIKQFEFTIDDFSRLWDMFSNVESQEIKHEFYQWIAKEQAQQGFPLKFSMINKKFTTQLKQQIFTHILSDSNKLDYINLSMEELIIFYQFMIHTNMTYGTLVKKSNIEFIKAIFVEDPEIQGYKNLWDIFLNCKNFDVIQKLANYIITFNFNYSYKVKDQVKKAKLQVLMNRIEKHIKDGFKKGNVKLMKHSLYLLKSIIQLIKEKKKYQEIDNPMLNRLQFKAPLKVFQEEKLEHFEVNIYFSQQYYKIKQKIASHLKIDKSKFVLRTQKGQIIFMDLLEANYFLLPQKNLTVVLKQNLSFNPQALIMKFLKEKLQEVLIDMLQNESICENVFLILEEIEINQDEKEVLFERMTPSILKNNNLSTNDIYYHIFYLKLFNSLVENQLSFIKIIKSEVYHHIIKMTSLKIKDSITSKLLGELNQSILKILKKYNHKVPEDVQTLLNISKSTLIQQEFQSLKNICEFLLENQNQESILRQKIAKIFMTCMTIIEISQNISDLADLFLNYEGLNFLMECIYLKIKNCNEIKFVFTSRFKKYIHQKQINYGGLSQDLQRKICQVIIKHFYYKILLNEKVSNQFQNNSTFYRFVGSCLSIVKPQFFEEYICTKNEENKSFFQNVLEIVSSEEDSTDPTKEVNFLLFGHLHILNSILQVRPALVTQQIIQFILYECLFYKPQRQYVRSDVRCKRTDNIRVALEILLNLIIKSPQQINQQRSSFILSEIGEFHKTSFWRSSEYWNVSIEEEVKAKYVGLENPGCICYMNSLLQQLYMTEGFRNAILKLNLNRQVEDKEESLELLEGLKELFLKLQNSEEVSINPVFFSKTIKNHDKKPMIKVFQQMDIDEFCSILFDKMERLIPYLPDKTDFIKEHFGGIYAHQVISKQCEHSSEREEQFLTISLDVKKSISECFTTLVKGEILDGQNKYYCERCDKKVKAQKRLTLKNLPTNLVLSLKRFQFDYEIDAKIKRNDYCEFPKELNLQQFSQQEIMKATKPSEQVQGEKMVDENQQKTNIAFPPQYFVYKLKGVVVHTGSADSGHYYSYIEDKEKNWFQFNDEKVSPFDENQLAQECFGRKEPDSEKVKNAYLLFYQRVSQGTQVTQESIQKQIDQNQCNKKIVAKIQRNNKEINKFRLFFSKDYNNFVDSLVKTNHPLKKSQIWNKYIISYFLLIKLRESNVNEVVSIANYINNQITVNRALCEMLLSAFNSPSSLEEFFVYASNREKSKILAHLLVKAWITYDYFKKETHQNLTQIDLDFADSVTNLFAINGSVFEVQLILRKYVEHLTLNKNIEVIKMFYLHGTVERLVDAALGYTIEKTERQKIQEKNKQMKLKTDERIGFNKNQGRKYNPSNNKQSWHAIYAFNQALSKIYHGSQIPEEIKTFLDQENAKFQKTSIAKLAQTIYECSHTKAILAFSLIFTKFDTSNLLGAIEKALKDYESIKYRAFLFLISRIILVEDKESTLRIKYIIKSLKQAHKHNQKYFLESDLIHQWILKYVSTSRKFLKIFAHEHKDFIMNMIEWCQNKMAPAAQTVKKPKNPSNERLNNRLHGIIVSADPKDYEKNSHIKVQQFGKLLDDSYLPCGDIKEADIENQKYGVGTQVEIYENRVWRRGIVIENNYSCLRIKRVSKGIEESYAEFWEDSQKIKQIRLVVNKIEEEVSPEKKESVEIDEEGSSEEDLYN